MTSSAAPLQGLRVLDTTDDRGELAGRLLADLGADVVRVEPSGGAASRSYPPFAPDGTSLYFSYRNANKRTACIDLSGGDGRDRFEALLAGADVWIESGRPGAAAAIGLDPAAVAERHPHLVVVSVTDFGHTGPYRDYVGSDMVGLAMSSMLYRGGVPELPPLAPPGALAYDVAGVVATFAALTAYRQRQRTGRGQHVDLSVMEAVAQITDWGLPNASSIASLGFDYPRVRGGSGPVYPIYPCADGHVRLIILSPRSWWAMRDWLGEPDWLQDPQYDGMLGRLMVADVLDILYRELFADKTKAELAEEGQRRGIALTPVLSLAEVLESDHFRARGAFPERELSPGVRAKVPAGFFEIDGRRTGLERRAPLIGEHDDAIGWDARPAPAGAAPPPPRPLDDLRVLDFGIGGVGVEAGRMLADYGADVIKIETRTYPDFIRKISGSEMSASFASSSRNKRSFGVNAKTDAGRAVLRRLVADADVLIENGSVGAMDSIDLGYDELRRINPRLVIVSSQLLGSSGPWSGWMGYGPSSRTMGGMAWLWNYEGGDEPPGSAAIHPDHLCGRVCAVAALAGLIGREASGRGLHAEVAQVEVVTATLGDLFAKESLQPGSVVPQGNASERGAPWGVYQCAGDERWCVINVRDDDEWARLRAVMGDPEWAHDPDLATAAGRRARRHELDELLTSWTSGRSDHEVMELLQARGIPAGRMADSLEQEHDPHLVARGYPQRIEQPGLGQVLLEGPAFHASAMPDPETRPAPGLGEHTRQICRELLGMSDDEVDKLVAEGALEEDEAY